MIEHSRYTRKEGYYRLFWTLVVCVGLPTFQYYVFPNHWARDRFFVIASFGILTVIGSLGCWYAIANIVANDEFRCFLTADALACYCPVKGAGETFTVKLSDITKLEKECGSDSHRWYIWDRDDNRYWLTSNFGNPCEQIVDLIQELRPIVVQVGTAGS